MTITQIDLTATVNGVVYDLADLIHFQFLDADGFGMAPVKRLTQKGPMQDGVSDIGFRLDARHLTLTLLALGTDEASYYAAREALLSIFTPTVAPIKLTFYAPPDRVRQIDVHFNSNFSLPFKSRYGMSQQDVIELYAPDPTWYDPVLVNIPFQASGGGTGMPFPLTFPVTFGATVSINQTQAVTNAGSYRTYPVIILYGPITNPVITNTTTGEVLSFVGTAIGTNQTWTIDCRYGYKTVTDQLAVNKIASLLLTSDLSTFHLEPGANSINVTGGAVNGTTQASIQFYSRYVGI